MKARLYAAWDRFLLYVPMACMAVLALGTYWMVRTTPPASEPVAQRPVRHEPDYSMTGVTFQSWDAKGRMRSAITGDTMRHYADNEWTDIDRVRVRNFDEKGQLTTASADRGLSNEDGSQVQLIGNAVVVREPDTAKNAKGTQSAPRMEYRSEFLHVFLDTERLTSHKPVQLTRGKDQFTADSMDYDNLEQVITLRGRVRATLMPAQSKP